MFNIGDISCGVTFAPVVGDGLNIVCSVYQFTITSLHVVVSLITCNLL